MEENTEQKFQRLAEQFYRETFFLSCAAEYTHPAMRKIIDMGKPVLPLIFKEMQDGASSWYYAVREITGEQPPTITEDDAGRIEVLNEKYLQWGKEKGFIDED